MTSANGREAAHPIEPLFLERWSPRAYDGSAIGEDAIASLFEAARWAPSAFNAQPWRFVYARRDTPEWPRFLAALLPGNQAWVKDAGLLIYLLSDSLSQSRTDAEPKPSHSHSFDAGAAWALLALQAVRLGLHAHGMVGIDFDAARALLGAPDRFRIEAAIAVGRLGDKASLPEALQAREVPSGRRPIEAFAFEGGFR